MAGEVVVDALPYIDQGYDEPGVREAVGITRINISATPPSKDEIHRTHIYILTCLMIYGLFRLDVHFSVSLNFQALAMVEEETRRYRPTKNYLEHLPPLNLSAFEVSIQANLLGLGIVLPCCEVSFIFLIA
jgi:pre-mRNA-splicing factor SPF27